MTGMIEMTGMTGMIETTRMTEPTGLVEVVDLTETTTGITETTERAEETGRTGKAEETRIIGSTKTTVATEPSMRDPKEHTETTRMIFRMRGDQEEASTTSSKRPRSPVGERR